MGYLPIFLDVGGRPCLVIGGGHQAESRVRNLLDAGALVTVISREVTDGLKFLAADGDISYFARAYRYGDLRGQSLAYVIAEDPQIARCASEEARQIGIPLNVADQPEASTFISPATFKRGDLQVAISTGGSSPAVASLLRHRLERELGPGYAKVLEIMRLARQFLRNREADQSVRALKLKSLAEALLNSVETLDESLINKVLSLHLHANMAELGFEAGEGCR